MHADRPFLGVLLMLVFCCLAPLGDGIAKFLGDTVALGQLLFIRFAAQAAILVPLVWAAGGSLRTPRRIFGLLALRTVLHIAGVGAMFTSLRYLPLADALAIAFVMPFIMLFLGRYVLGEEVGVRRIAAAVVGFAGTLLVIQPSFEKVGAPALLPLAVAFLFSFFMLVTRRIAKETDPIAVQAVSGLMATPMLGAAILLLSGVTEMADLSAPTRLEWALLAAIGVIGTVAHLCMTWSLRFAPSATLAPMQYMEIPVATVVGWLMFRDLPNGLAAVGILITMAAGLYAIWRERVSSTNG